MSSLSISTWVYFWKPLKEVLNDIAEAGFSFVEIWANETHLDPRTHPNLQSIKRVLHSLSLQVHSLHAPFSGIDISSIDKENRKYSINLIKKSMEHCAEIGGDTVIIHPCATETYGDIQYYTEAKNMVKDSLITLTIIAERLGIKLAVENVPNIGGWSFGYRMSELIKIILDINNSHLGLCLDTGHVFINNKDANIVKNIITCGKNLIALHIQDTDGKKDRHWMPGEGFINWNEFFKNLFSIEYKGFFTMEISGSTDITERNVDNIILKCKKSMKNMLKL